MSLVRPPPDVAARRRHRARPLRACALLAALAGCVSAPTPGVSPDLLAALADADTASTVPLMRQQGERFAGVPFLPGNRADLLVDGPATFAAMQAAIATAHTRIDMESYEFDASEGAVFADLLITAAHHGVTVNLIYDAWGASETPSALFDRMRQGGVQVLEFNPMIPNERVPIEFNKRDHRKLLCVDGRLVITGGVNISHVYRNTAYTPGADPDDQAWRDTDVRITGPVVAQFETYFMETWQQQNGPPLAPPPPTPPTHTGNLMIQAIDGAPDSEQPLIYRTLLASMALAKRSIHLTTGFFVPTPDLKAAMIAAARRGVDVRIIVPGTSDSTAALAAGRADYGDLLDAGVRIYERQNRILHAKTAVIDHAWSAIGSSNLDWRSAVWNNEIDAIILGTDFGAQMEAMFKSDQRASIRITFPIWHARGLGERFQEFRAKLIQTLL